MQTLNLFANDSLINLAASQIDRNGRIARLFVDTAASTVDAQVERASRVAVALSNETRDMVTETTDAVAGLFRSGLETVRKADSDNAKPAKK